MLVSENITRSLPLISLILSFLASVTMAQYGTAPRLDRQPLQIYSSGRTDEETSNTSPSSGTTTSPTSPFSNNLHGIGKSEGDEEQCPGPEKTDPVKENTKSGKEKRKRSRVTPEQLVHLENYFEMDRSPTAARRKDISEILGMQERQTQIWFQNRCVPIFAINLIHRDSNPNT